MVTITAALVGSSNSLERFRQEFNTLRSDVSNIDPYDGSSIVSTTSIVSGGFSSLTDGTSNFIAGLNAGAALQSGSLRNVLVGDEAGSSITTGDDNVAIGYAALDAVTTASDNTAVGSTALDANTEGASNVAIGYAALGANTTASSNTAVGANSLDDNTEGHSNTAVGVASLGANTTGDNNTAVGYHALLSNETSEQNTAVGSWSLDANTTGSNNTGIGIGSLGANTTGTQNTALGAVALLVNTTASHNTGVGYGALQNNLTGTHNTAVGSLCHDNLTTGDLNTAIGYNLAPSAVGVDSEIVIGSSITGGGTNTVRIGTGGGTATLGLDGSDTSWAAASDVRLKKDVATSTAGLEFIKDLRPVTFKWQLKNDVESSLPQYDADSSIPVYGLGKEHHGFIAQEVKDVIDAHSDVVNGHNIWHEDPDGTQQVAPGALVPMLVKAIQEQNILIESSKVLIEALTARIIILEE
jgi:hypothetical protein